MNIIALGLPGPMEWLMIAGMVVIGLLVVRVLLRAGRPK